MVLRHRKRKDKLEQKTTVKDIDGEEEWIGKNPVNFLGSPGRGTVSSVQ